MKKALAMALAIMCVLALAGCGTNPAKEVLPWMQNLKADDISEVQVWNMSTAEDLKKVLTKEETAELVALLNALTEDDFQDNSALRGSTPDYGMDIVVDGESTSVSGRPDRHGKAHCERIAKANGLSTMTHSRIL